MFDDWPVRRPSSDAEWHRKYPGDWTPFVGIDRGVNNNRLSGFKVKPLTRDSFMEAVFSVRRDGQCDFADGLDRWPTPVHCPECNDVVAPHHDDDTKIAPAIAWICRGRCGGMFDYRALLAPKE